MGRKERHKVQPTAKEVIAARYAMVARVQGMVENDELLLSIVKTFAQCIR